MSYPSKTFLNNHFKYENGFLIRTIKDKPEQRLGNPIGYERNPDGYRKALFNKKHLYVHRLIWIFFNGYIDASTVIDHIDGNPRNNRIENLRMGSQLQNSQNRRRYSGKTLPGTSYDAKRNDYLARVHFKKKVYRKYFKNELDAHNWYIKTKREVHEFCTI